MSCRLGLSVELTFGIPLFPVLILLIVSCLAETNRAHLTCQKQKLI